MRHPLIAALAFISAMLCVAILAQWVRSHWRQDMLGKVTVTSTPYVAEERLTSLRSNLGEIGLMFRTRELYALPEPYSRQSEPWRFYSDPAKPKDRIRNTPGLTDMIAWLGFAWSSYERRNTRTADGSWSVDRQGVVAVPHWFAAILLAQLPAAWWRRTRIPACRGDRGTHQERRVAIYPEESAGAASL